MSLENLESKSFAELLESEFVTEPTRRVLRERLESKSDYEPQFFTVAEFKTIKALCETLAPSQAVPCDFVASEIDKRLTTNEGNGWRYAEMPTDGETYQTGLTVLDEESSRLYKSDFAALTLEQRREIITKLRDEARNEAVQTTQSLTNTESTNFSTARFLEETITEFAEIFYSHPKVLEEIGYIGFADKQGWDVGVQSPESKVQSQRLEVESSSFEVQSSIIKVESSPLKIQNPKSKIQSATVVVIGTGAGGAPILARLAAAGLRVVALEAGKSFDYTQFATDERSQKDIYWRDERLSAGENPVAFGNNNSGCGVGGSTIHFTAYTPRAQADDFTLFSEFGVGKDWCVPYQSLEPYYDYLEQFLGVSGNSNYPWGTRKTDYALPPLPLNGAAKLMQKACADLGIQTSSAPNAALSQDYYRDEIGWRPKCTNRGFCQAGCSVGAKSSMDTTFLPFACKNGAEIISESFVTEFEFDSNKQIKSVVYQRDGQSHKIDCDYVFLCAGAIETPRLLLMNGIANSSGQVGKNFMAHTGVQVWGTFDEPIYPHKGIPGGLISEDTHRPKEKFGADFAGGYLLQSIGVMPVTYASQLARGEKVFGGELDEWMRDYNHTAGINILGECLPYANNYVELSDEKDNRGFPKPLVHFTEGENETKMNAHAENLMREIWNRAGARKTWAFQRNAHIIGTCRMGIDAAENVVDENCKSFDIENLYICDNSVFPSSLAVNPALTIMALALRTANRFLRVQSPKSKSPKSF
ncbi:MAG: GMC family oxidoreductase N-terminal domain-containing protein [Pyrinomonadaceae bacterium]|nr:GMC family oxidoreductase N-terminal domain-containing protein [Pyrinomonadaceae bacterium]